MGIVFRKELADHLNSTRFIILFCLVVCVALLTTNTVSLNLRSEIEGGLKEEYLFLRLFTTSGHFFSLLQFIAFFGPLIGIVMGFDAVNRERNEGTLSMVMAQPVYRDAIINGKFLAGFTIIAAVVLSLALLISGLGMIVVGVVPSPVEVARLLLYVVLSVIYIGFWLGLAVLLSIIFRSIGTSALAAITFWILVSFFVSFATRLAADVLAPLDAAADIEQQVKHLRIADYVGHISPVNLYNDAAAMIMDPFRRTTKSSVLAGPLETISVLRFSNPLSLGQSLLVVAPYLITILALTTICFALSYWIFMRQEVR